MPSQLTGARAALRRTLAGAAAAAGALALTATVAAPAHAEAAPLPVPYTFLSGAVDEITHPDAPPAGANDWSCRPTPEHPRPVVLVHGTMGGDATNWATLSPLLANAGYCVFSLTYGAVPGTPWPVTQLGGLSPIDGVSIPQAADFVTRVLAATGADQADLVGHSQGTIVSGAIAKHALPGRIHAVVSLSALWQGSGGPAAAGVLAADPAVRPVLDAGSLQFGEQMLTGSSFLDRLRGPDDTPYAPGVAYTNIATRYDEFVLPYTSGLEAAPDRPGYTVTNAVVQDGCPVDLTDHIAIPADPRAADLVLGALDPAHAPAPRCVPVAPVHGAVGAVPEPAAAVG